MPRYYFDIDDSISVCDEQGQELADQDAARIEAFQRAAAYGGNPDKLREGGIIVVTVRTGPETVNLRVRLVCQVEEMSTDVVC